MTHSFPTRRSSDRPTDAGTPIFDEKHYAPQAWQMLGNGGLEDNPGYGLVVHPPLSKALMAVGEWIFGYNGLGWRFSGAVCGVIIVILRSEEHTSELQSLMRNSYAVFCLKKT